MTQKTPAEIEKNKKLIGVNYKTKNGKLVADEIYSDGSIREVNVNNGIVNYILEGETSAPELEEMTGNSNLSSEEEIIEMEIIEREAKKFGGNASHVILPTKYNGKKVQIKILNQKALSLQRQELASLQEKIEKLPVEIKGEEDDVIMIKQALEIYKKSILKIFKEMGQ